MYALVSFDWNKEEFSKKYYADYDTAHEEVSNEIFKKLESVDIFADDRDDSIGSAFDISPFYAWISIDDIMIDYQMIDLRLGNAFLMQADVMDVCLSAVSFESVTLAKEGMQKRIFDCLKDSGEIEEDYLSLKESEWNVTDDQGWCWYNDELIKYMVVSPHDSYVVELL